MNPAAATAAPAAVTAIHGSNDTTATAALEPGAGPNTRAHQLVALQRTRTNPAEIRATLARAHERLTGHAPAPALLDVLTAHCEHETGRGHAMYNYNFGGIRGRSPAGLSASSMTREVVAGQDVRVRGQFRAYTSLDEGAADYLSLMQRRYGTALELGERGDVDGFAHALRARGYYSASETEYADDLRGLLGLPRVHGASPDAAASPALALTGVGAGTDADAATGAAGFSTTEQLSRMLDALSSSSARIASPDSDET